MHPSRSLVCKGHAVSPQVHMSTLQKIRIISSWHLLVSLAWASGAISQLMKVYVHDQNILQSVLIDSAMYVYVMNVIRHTGVDSRMIILDNQTCQQMTHHFQLSFQCNVSPITGFDRHTWPEVCLMKPVMGESDNLKWQIICWHAWLSKRIILLRTYVCIWSISPVINNIAISLYNVIMPSVHTVRTLV